MKFDALIKDIDIKTLVSGDKSTRILLELTNPEQIPSVVAALSLEMFVIITADVQKGS